MIRMLGCCRRNVERSRRPSCCRLPGIEKSVTRTSHGGWLFSSCVFRQAINSSQLVAVPMISMFGIVAQTCSTPLRKNGWSSATITRQVMTAPSWKRRSKSAENPRKNRTCVVDDHNGDRATSERHRRQNRSSRFSSCNTGFGECLNYGMVPILRRCRNVTGLNTCADACRCGTNPVALHREYHRSRNRPKEQSLTPSFLMRPHMRCTSL